MSAVESNEIKADSLDSAPVTENEETTTPVDIQESEEQTEEKTDDVEEPEIAEPEIAEPEIAEPEIAEPATEQSTEFAKDDKVEVAPEASNEEHGETELNEELSDVKAKDAIEQDESVADEEESIDSAAVQSEYASNISSAPNSKRNSLNDIINRPKNISGLKNLALSTSNIEREQTGESKESDIKDNKDISNVTKKITINNNLSTDSIQKGLKNWFSFKTKSSEDLADETETGSTNNNNNNILSNLDITKKLLKPENFSFALFRFNENRDSLLSKSENDRDAANRS
ncbi:unnamed protein product [[Candida] boidinii]|nr:unnamed protein product [[Candida] boidinii]